MNPKNGGSKQLAPTSSKSDGIKWLLVLVLIVGGIVANAYYSQVAWALRAAAGIVLATIVIVTAAFTVKGQSAWVFIKGSRAEMRKVVWPTRQETIQTALVVVGMVIVASIILWSLDNLFLWLVGILTGQR